jgi:putative serine/threonine protein kinase
MKYEKIKKIAKGWSSYIFLAKVKSGKLKGKKVTIKETREKSNRKNLAEREGRYLTLANKVGIGPKIVEINYEKNFVSYIYVSGENLFTWIMSKEFESATKKEIYELVKEIYRQALVLDKASIAHTQLQVGKNIIITKKKIKGKTKYVPTIIDFETSNLREDCDKNEGQILSFLFYNPNGSVAKKIRKKLNLKL